MAVAVTSAPAAEPAPSGHPSPSEPATNGHPSPSQPASSIAIATPADSGRKDPGSHPDAMQDPRNAAAEPVSQASTDVIAPPLGAVAPAPPGDAAAQVAHALTDAATNALANGGKAPSAPIEPASPNIGYAIAARVPVSLTVRLTPVELGTVSIQIDRPVGAPATVTLTAERPETLALLQRDHAQLNQALDRAGVVAEGRVLMFHLSPPAEATQAPALQPLPAFAPSHAGSNFDAASSGSGGASAWQAPSSDSRQPPSQQPQRATRQDDDPEPSMPNAGVVARRTLSDRINITA